MAWCFRDIRRHMCMLVRQNFAKSCEKKLNDQINMELKASHQYLAMVRFRSQWGIYIYMHIVRSIHVGLPFRSLRYQFTRNASILPKGERRGAGARGEDHDVHEQAWWSNHFEQCTTAVALFRQHLGCTEARNENGTGGQ